MASVPNPQRHGRVRRAGWDVVVFTSVLVNPDATAWVEIDILTPDLKLHPNYDHRPDGLAIEAGAK